MKHMVASEQLEPSNSNHHGSIPLAEYPSWYVSEFQARDGEHFNVRPIRTDDEPLMRDFHSHLSEETVYRRYFSPLRLDIRVAHERLLQR
jgi:acetyltransferase